MTLICQVTQIKSRRNTGNSSQGTWYYYPKSSSEKHKKNMRGHINWGNGYEFFKEVQKSGTKDHETGSKDQILGTQDCVQHLQIVRGVCKVALWQLL